jgi:tetratricopeptide (TPR) repeat protein
VLLAAQRLDPNVGYAELGYLYGHLGLPNLAERASRRALEIDPTSDFAKRMLLLAYESSAQHDQWFEAHERLFPNEPIESVNFLSAGRLDEARRALDRVATNNSAQFQVLPSRALLAALKGDVRAAEAAIPALLGRHVVKDPYYHHVAYIVACIYAIGGKSVEAMKWLREAVATGFAVYPLYERIGFLDRIRQTPDFVQFMAELKATTDRYHREFESR